MPKSELPKSWEREKLGDLLVEVKSGFACSKKYAANSGIPHLRTNNIGLNGELDLSDLVYLPSELVDSDTYNLHAGDVLFNNTNSVELVGKTAIVRKDLPYAFSNHITRLRTKNDFVDPRWLTLSLRSYWLEGVFAKGCRRWIGQAGFNPTMLVEIEIPLPPLEEQRRIVARIEELLSRIEQAKSLRQKSLNETSIVLHAAVNEVFKFGKKDGWPAKNISDILTEKPQYGTSQKASENNLGTPLIRMGNIIDGRLSFDDLKFIQLPESEERKYLLRHGDILFNRTNSAELVGKTAVFSEEKKAVFASYLIRLKVDSDKATPHFVAAYINSLFGRAYIQSQLTRAIGQVNVNARKLLEMPILIPDIYEQRRIVAYLDSLQEKVNKLKRLQSETEKEIEQITQSILSKAFQGTL